MTQPADDSAHLAETVTILSAALVQAFAQAERDLIAGVARDARVGLAAPAGSAARLGMLRAMQATAARIVSLLGARITPLVRSTVREATRRGDQQALRTLTSLVASHPSLLVNLTRLQPEPVTPLGLSAANRIQIDLLSRLQDAHLRITRYPRDAYQAAVARAAQLDVLTGQSPAASQRNAWDDLTSRGITGFTDVRGRQWNLASYVEMATRTAVQRAYNQAHMDRMLATGIERFTIAPHAHPCPLCQPWEGRVLTADEVDTARGSGLFHPNCFPGEVLVSAPSGVRAADSRWYEGELVVIHTASGNELSVTPNHPVLTLEGWVAAGVLTVGQSVLSYRDDVERVDGVGPHDEQVPAPIGEVFDALRHSSGVATMTVPAAAEQFHGDGEGSDVEVVLVDSLLQDAVDAHGLRDRSLLFGGAGLPGLAGDRTLDELGMGPLLPPDGVMGGSGQSGTLCARHASHAGAAGLFGVATDASTEQPFTDYGLGHAESLANLALGDPLGAELDGLVEPDGFGTLGKSLEGNPGGLEPAIDRAVLDADAGRDLAGTLSRLVSADDVVKVERRRFAGHVYNLQSGDGWYVAGNIVVHNCTHTVVAYFAGITRFESLRPRTERDRAAYAATQRLRMLERQVRAAKLQEAGALNDLDRARARRRARAAQAAIRAHLQSHPTLLRRRRREQINLGN